MSKWFKMISLIVLISILITSACQSENLTSQSNPSNNNTLVVRPHSDINSKVCGTMNEIKHNGEDIKTFILSQPMPEMWIVEKGKDDKSELDCNGVRINLSDKSKKLLQQHWRDRLNYSFLNNFDGTEKGMEGVKRDNKLSKSFLETERNLKQTPVANGDNQRSITPEEADKLLIFLRDSSNEVTQAVKKLNK